MRSIVAIATFLAVGVGAAGVGALNLKGSDTLKDTTVTLLTEASPDCGGTGQAGTLVYDGTGSGNGQAALVANSQQVAPMSRAMNNGACGANQATGEGIVFELDGLSVVGDGPTWGACNGANELSCIPDPAHPQGGISYNNKVITPTPVASCSSDADCNDPTAGRSGIFGEVCESNQCVYHLTTWKQALRVLYFGVSSTDASGNVNKLNHRNCNSPERQFLAANWNQFLQTCSSSSCPAGIQHAFRRNDESGTTDVFVSLLGVASISQINHTSPFCNVGTQGPTFFAASPPDKECNVDTDCVAASPPAGICATDTTSSTGKRCSIVANQPQSPASTFDATLPPPLVAGRLDLAPTGISICPANGKYTGEYFVDLQDHDVIRRVCKASATGDQSQEDVCSTRGDMGLVLPIWDLPADNAPIGDAFPTATCSNGKFLCSSAVQTSCPGVNPKVFQICPDGSDPNAPSGTNLCPPGQCAYPAISVPNQPLDPRCVATKTAKPPGTGTFDGRVFNLTTWTGTPATGFAKVKVPRATGMVKTVGNTIQSTTPVDMVGSYYRIHSVHTMDPTGALAACHKQSATDQIGCLVHASPCSVGYAGNSAADGTNTIALKVNNVDPNNLCVQNFLTLGASDPSTYPLSRKLYLNSLLGFETVTGDQLKLANCFANGTAGGVATGIGFVPLPATDAAKTAAKAFCEDFNEVSTCGASGTNSNACANNTGSIPSCQFGQDPVAAGCHFGP